jgi:alcohol dehydrogenase YqhD (iron-dependent ADH family)
MNEPVALRYDFDGNGYLYMDAGSGSDWASRVKDCEFLYTHPLTNAEPIAWVYPEFMKNIKDAKCWTAYATYHKDRPIPLYTHPMRDDEDDDIFRKEQVKKFYAEARPLSEKYKLRELTDEEIIDAWKMFSNWGHEQHILMFGRELLKKASEK